MSQQATLLVGEYQANKQSSGSYRKVTPFRNQSTSWQNNRKIKKNHQNFATVEQPKAESGLSKQL